MVQEKMLNKTPGKAKHVVYWSRPLDWRNQTLTPKLGAIHGHWRGAVLEHALRNVPAGNADG